MDSVFRLILSSTGGGVVANSLNGISGSLKGMLASAVSLTAVLGGLREAFRMGDELTELSRRTGSSVGDLVELKRAFERAGLGADQVGPMINRLQKAIAGLNEDSKPTAEALKALGLSAGGLRDLSPTEQLKAMATAFARLTDPTQRAALAMALFGKSGGQMLQLLRAPETFREAQEEAGRLAQRTQENAERFHEVGERLSLIHLRLQEMWAVAAEKLLPSLEKVAGVIKGINLGPIGAALPSAMGAFGALMGAALVRRLDDAVVTWAVRARSGSLSESIFMGLAPVTGLLARVLPIGLAAVVAKELVTGIVAAWVEARVQIIRDAARHGTESVLPIIARAGGVRSDEERKAVLADAEEERKRLEANLQAEGGRWVKSKEAIADYRNQLLLVNGVIADMQSSWADERMLENADKDRIDAMKLSNEEAAKWLSAKGGEADQLRRKIADSARFVLQDSEQQLKGLQASLDITGRNAETYAFLREAGRLTRADEKAALENAAQRAELLQQISTLEAKVARFRAEAAQSALDERTRRLSLASAAIEGDFTQTEAEKWPQKKLILEQQIDLEKQQIDNLRALRGSTRDEGAQAVYDSAIRGAEGRLGGLQQQWAQLGADPNSWTQQMQSGLTQLRQGWGTAAQGIAQTISGTIGSAVDAVSSSISGLILRTQTWREALTNVGRSILTTLVSSIVQLGVRWVATSLMMAVAGKAIAAASTAMTAPIAMAQSAIWATPATLATIATLGGAAVQAPMSIAGSIAMTQGMSLAAGGLGGFKLGGYSPPGDSNEVAGVTHRNEWTAPAWMVKNPEFGSIIAMLEAVRQGRPGYFLGGYSIGEWLGSGGLPFAPGMHQFQSRWNLMDGSKIVGSFDMAKTTSPKQPNPNNYYINDVGYAGYAPRMPTSSSLPAASIGGAAAGGGAAGAGRQLVILITDDLARARTVARDPEWDSVVMDTVERNKARLIG